MIDLKTIGAEMAVQQNDATQFPMWVVEHDIRTYCTAFDDYDGKERVEDVDTDDLCSSCQDILARTNDSSELPDDCNDCDSGAFLYYRDEQELDMHAGAFLTKKACQDHIKENDYHYNNPHTYCVSAWRNYEMQDVMVQLIELAGKEVPSHYGGPINR